MRVLYISQNGAAENLGQSQVLPYLRGLARWGAEIDLLTYELATLTHETREEIAADLQRNGIRWHPLVRTMGTSIDVKVREAAGGLIDAVRIARERRPEIVHGRSYFASAICDALASASSLSFRRKRPKLLFDCRGMLGDEYVDCGHWTKDRLEYRLVKGYERRLMKRADGIVVLTHALARWIAETGLLGSHPTLEVIPCCVDLEAFRPKTDARAVRRAELGIEEDAFVIVYSGSLGTWYLEPEMTRFAAAVKQRAKRKVKVVCFTPSDATPFRSRLEAAGFASEDVIVRKVPPKQMPDYLAVGDVGVSFIQSCFSKKGSSPTKVAEYLACGNVAVVNGDIGDQADLRSEAKSCVVLGDFSETEIERAADAAIALAHAEDRRSAAREAAERHFDLARVGVARYSRLYEALVVGAERR